MLNDILVTCLWVFAAIGLASVAVSVAVLGFAFRAAHRPPTPPAQEMLP